MLLVLCTAFRAWAQFGAATVVGVVQDSSKAGITDAKLKLINTQTGTENDSATDQAGGFLLPGVIPGPYTLQIERDGFATTQVNGIELDAGDAKNLLIRMKVGAVTETVNVDASALTLNRSNASVSTVVDRKLIAKVPLSGRSLQDLISLTPGIVTESPQAATQSGTQTQGDFSVNGEPTESNLFFVDGVSANIRSVLASSGSHTGSSGSIAGSTALGTTQSLISVDALQEFRVLSSTYSAEYGRTPGGQFTFLTRSGGNDVHGSIYNYFRSNLLDAKDWFSTTRVIVNGDHKYSEYIPAGYSQNDFGATLGAPIVLPRIYDGRNRSFLFLSYEGLYVDQQTPQTYSFAPTLCYGLGPTACPGVPLEVGAALQTFPIGAPTATNPGLGYATVDGFSFPSHVNASSVRVDHIFSPRFSIFIRYGDTPSDGAANQLYSVTTYRNRTQTVTLGATNQLSANHSNELRFGYTGSNANSAAITEDLVSTGGGHVSSNPNGDLNADLGASNVYGPASADAYIHITGVGDSDSNTDQATGSLDEWNLRDTFSVTAQNHLLRFGVDQRHIRAGISPPALSVLSDFFTLDSLVENSASDLVVTRSTPARPVLNEFSAFAEDEWKIWPSLSLSLGLRWDVNPAPKGQHGQDAYTVLGDVAAPATLQLAPRGTSLWHTGWFNLAPRLGAAWVARGQPGRELLVRAGGGVFFDTGTRVALRAFDGIGFATSAYFLGAPVPATSSQIAFPTAVTAPYSNMQAFALSPHLQLPYSWQWNLGVEQALGRNQSITVSYVGAAGRRLLQEQRRNVSAVNPDFGDVTYFPSGLSSSFQSLQTKFQRSLSPGIEVLASYTWAHSLDYGSTDPAYPLQWGNSNLDVRQNLEAAASWSSAPARRFLSFRRALEGWEADGRLIARTGFPVDLLGNFFFDPVTGKPYYSGVDLVPGKPFYLHDSQLPGGRMFNGGQNVSDPAFVLPAGAAQGDAPRNFVRGFPAVQGNLAVQQSVRLPERLNVQIKAETFNVFNHPNFGYIDPSLSDLLFGQSTKKLDQSFGSSGALYNQGGPRAIQLSLKLEF